MSITYVSRICKEKGLKIVDARKTVVLGVAVDDIVNSKSKNSKCCAFARAAKRSLRGVRAAYFFRTTAFLEFDDRVERYAVSSAAQREIISFDRAGIMAPGTYQINPPPPTRERAALKRYSDTYWDRVRSGVNPPPRKREINPLLVTRRGAAKVAKKALPRRTPFIRTLDEPAE